MKLLEYLFVGQLSVDAFSTVENSSPIVFSLDTHHTIIDSLLLRTKIMNILLYLGACGLLYLLAIMVKLLIRIKGPLNKYAHF